LAPETEFGTRGLPRGVTVKTQDFWERYDSSTLIYDCVWLPQEKVLRLYLPKPIGFATQLKASRFALDGETVSIAHWRRFRQYDEIDFTAPQKPSQLEVVTTTASSSISVNDNRSDIFAGRNVLYTMLRNDDLRWVHDWGLAHQRNHGTDAILIADNGSTAYSTAELLQTIRSIPGIEVAQVLTVPFRHGPSSHTCSGVGATKFLQTACLNLCRGRFFSTARGVLVCDVDELVFSRDGESIYDATANSLTKYKTFHGHWRFANATVDLSRHKDHVFADKGTGLCASKYCIVPDSVFGRMSWSVHSLENVNRRIFRRGKRFGFYHCQSINTSWKSPRHATPTNHTKIDPATATFLNKTFPTPV
jgi:hypothetical protein